MLRILHLADLHLGWRPAFMPRDKAEERRRRRDALLAKAVDLALSPEQRIGLVVIAGDLFETHRPEEPLAAAAMAQLRRLEEAGIPVITVPGNHDEITYPNSVYQRHRDEWPGILVTNPNPEHVTSLTVQGETVHVYGLAYTGGVTRTRPPIDQFPRAEGPGLHIAIFHGTPGGGADDRSLPLSLDALRQAGYDYVALGHIHKPGEFPLGRGLAAYAGATEGKGFDDPGTGQFTIAQVEPQRVTLERVPAGVQPVVTRAVDVSSMEGAADAAAAVAELADPEAIARVRLVGHPADLLDPEEIAARAAHLFYYLEVVDETEALAPQVLDRWAGERTILGEFIRRMRRRLEAAADEEERIILERALRSGVQALRAGDR